MPDTKHTYTHIDVPGILTGMYICNDCGAQAVTPELIKHYPNCKPNESERWRKFYNDAPDKDDFRVYDNLISMVKGLIAK